jgi:hypothetical protein
MKDGLPCAGTDVQYSAVSLLDIPLSRDPRRRKMASSDNFRIGSLCFFQSCKMPLGNNKHMRRRLWADVFKREHVIVFVNFLRRNFSAENATKKTV